MIRNSIPKKQIAIYTPNLHTRMHAHTRTHATPPPHTHTLIQMVSQKMALLKVSPHPLCQPHIHQYTE